MIPGGFYRMNPLEVASGWLTGLEPATSPAEVPEGTRALGAFEQAVLPALRRSPCMVAFSGGRDSSVVLAVAIRLARREGLPAPVPVTRVFPDEPQSMEAWFQEQVIRHLGMTEWLRLPFRDELDLLGPVAQVGLRRHGLLWPPMIHADAPLLQAGAGGALVTGEGGDEVLGSRRVTPMTRVLRHGWRPDRAELKELSLLLAPGPWRRAALRCSLQRHLGASWLRPEAQQALLAAMARDEAGEPLRWHRSIARVARHRSVCLGLHNMDLLAAEAGVRYFHPFLAPSFLAALGRDGGRTGFVSRTSALRHIFGELLPEEVLARRSKARFNRVAVNRHSRRFVARWSGGGVDTDLVDAEALAGVWRAPSPHAMSLALLQAAWLAERGATC